MAAISKLIQERTGTVFASMVAAFIITTGLTTCATEHKAVIVKRNYKENFIIKRILIGYYSPDSIPPEKLKIAKQRLQASITCIGYDLIEDGIKDRTQTYAEYDPVLRTQRNYEYTRVFYWQKYRCRGTGGGKPGE